MTPISDMFHFTFGTHGDSVLQRMNMLREERRFCDVTLRISNSEFHGHKVVLAASSPFLRDQFLLHESREVNVSVLQNAEIGRRLMLSCYTGVLEFPMRELVSYLTAASALQMSHVVERCTQAVSQYLDPTLANLKQERGSEDALSEPERDPGSASVSGEEAQEDGEFDLDSEDSVQIVQTETLPKSPLDWGPAPGRRARPYSPALTPEGHVQADLADSSLDQDEDSGDIYMLAAHELQVQGLASGDLASQEGGFPKRCGGKPSPTSKVVSGGSFTEHDVLLQRPYYCRKCGRVFQHLENYMCHVKEHKLYLCLLCGKTFSQKSNLTRHIRVHTGFKPFECPLCKKAFSQKATLQDHINLHTGSKPHKCNYCAVHFAHKPGLRRHLKDIHGKSSLENMSEELQATEVDSLQEKQKICLFYDA
ncbi:zinc finger and BTB domain-containing protein 26-like [Lepisosteus oculatus]|uniref:zinc finger and BTB domain-containing protein 26-like n=1 Tax=Lepisosteus oculatus TaxID=7918 RepID=UPI00074028DF|nr:PREDICTED: zinc finger and BTB domain-containing protein 26-like [Lepisosteus oculatus]